MNLTTVSKAVVASTSSRISYNVPLMTAEVLKGVAVVVVVTVDVSDLSAPPTSSCVSVSVCSAVVVVSATPVAAAVVVVTAVVDDSGFSGFAVSSSVIGYMNSVASSVVPSSTAGDKVVASLSMLIMDSVVEPNRMSPILILLGSALVVAVVVV